MTSPLEKLTQQRDAAQKRCTQQRKGAKTEVYVGMATCEIAAGSAVVMDAFNNAIKAGLTDVYLGQRGCAGQCYREPTVQIVQQGKPIVRYGNVDAEKVKTIIEQHIKNGEVIKEWTIE